MVFDGIVLSIIVGFLRKGNLRDLATLNIKFGWMFPILLVIELAVFSLQNQYKFLALASGYIYILVYVLGLLFLFLNRRNPGFPLILIGVLLNFLVIVLNGGRMPVSLSAASILDSGYLDALKSGLYAKHQLMTQSAKLGFLGDIIPLSKPYPRTQIISIGDVVMNIGAFQYIQYLMVKKSPQKEDQDASRALKGGDIL